MQSNVISLASRMPKANTTNDIINQFTEDFDKLISRYRINSEDEVLAFDIATVHFLVQGFAHRSQGNTHPSQKVIDSIKDVLL